MSCPDPLHDYEDFNMDRDSNYDDFEDFYGDVTAEDLENMANEWDDENSGEADWNDEIDDSMDGDHESALSSAGWGTDENYGYYGEDVDYCEDFHSDDGCGYYDDGE